MTSSRRLKRKLNACKNIKVFYNKNAGLLVCIDKEEIHITKDKETVIRAIEVNNKLNNKDINSDEVLNSFVENLISNQKDVEPEFVDVVNKHFWEIL